MCTIRERINSFAALCNWIRELTYSIKELSNTVNKPAIWKMLEIESSQIQLQSSPIESESSPINFRISLIRELCYSIGELSNQ